MAQAAKGPQDDWSLGENEQCRHIINIIFTDLRNSIRLRDVNELILKLTSNNLLDNEKFKYKNEKTRGIKFQGLICADENGINQDSWKTRDTLMFWIKDIRRNFSTYLEAEKEFVLERLKRSTPVSEEWLTENVTLDTTNPSMGECLSLQFNVKHIKEKLEKEFYTENRGRFEKEFGSIETEEWNPAVFHLSANAFETTIGIFHEMEGRVLESRFYPHTYKEGHSKPIVYFAKTGDSSYSRAHPNEENKIAERDLDTRYEEIKHKDASDRSDLEMDFLEAYEKSQEETKRRGELTRKYELCKKEKDTLQEENASLRGEIRSVRQCCQTLKAQLDNVFQQLDRMETKIR